MKLAITSHVDVKIESSVYLAEFETAVHNLAKTPGGMMATFNYRGMKARVYKGETAQAAFDHHNYDTAKKMGLHHMTRRAIVDVKKFGSKATRYNQ